jgi:hypothetical protein
VAGGRLRVISIPHTFSRLSLCSVRGQGLKAAPSKLVILFIFPDLGHKKPLNVTNCLGSMSRMRPELGPVQQRGVRGGLLRQQNQDSALWATGHRPGHRTATLTTSLLALALLTTNHSLRPSLEPHSSTDVHSAPSFHPRAGLFLLLPA